MTDSSFIEVTCPKCRHVWHVDVTTLDKKDQIVYRGDKPQQKKYRIRCPNNCGTYVVVTVEFDEGEDG